MVEQFKQLHSPTVRTLMLPLVKKHNSVRDFVLPTHRRGSTRGARDIRSCVSTSHSKCCPHKASPGNTGTRDVRLLTSPLPYLTLVDQLSHVKSRFRLPRELVAPHRTRSRACALSLLRPHGATPARRRRRTGKSGSPAEQSLWTRRRIVGCARAARRPSPCEEAFGSIL